MKGAWLADSGAFEAFYSGEFSIGHTSGLNPRRLGINDFIHMSSKDSS